MNSIFRRCLLVVLCLSSGCQSTSAAAEPDQQRQPNVIIILADDLGYADVGYHGSKDVRTPNIDALAASGVRCTNGYVSAPVCGPVRAGLLTGRYQQRFGFEFNPTATELEGGIGLPRSETTLAERLKHAGYATGLIGKWHLGHMPQFQPHRRGFDEFFGFRISSGSYLPQNNPKVFRGDHRVEEHEYVTYALGREAISFIDRHKQQPFFLYLAFNAPHTPLEAPDELLKQFESISDPMRRTYAAMVYAMDQVIGRVRERIRSEGLEESTIFVFLSDNGGPTEKGVPNGSSNAPLRGSKYKLLEGGIRVPWIIAWKNHLPSDETYERPVIQIDLHPTVLATAGIQVQEEWELDGVNLLPYLRGEVRESPHEYLYWRFGESWAIRQGDWKLVKSSQNGARLYNLKTDLDESEDLAKEHPEMAAQLRSEWERWSAEMIPPMWEGRGSGTPHD